MPSNLITNLSAAVGAAASINVQPPVGQEYLVSDFFSQHAFVTGVPDLQVSLSDGATPCICLLDPTTDPGKRTRQFKFYITHALYLVITNTGAAGANLGYTGERVRAGLTIGNIVAIGAGAGVAIQPPDGQTWRISEMGASTWTAGPADINPDVSVGMTEGALIASMILDPTMIRGQDKQPEIYIDHTNYLYVVDTSGAGNNFAYCGRLEGKAAISSVQDVAGSATLDTIPPAGQQWTITEIGAETWGGAGAPNNYPDINVSLRVGTDLSDILEPAAGASVRWNTDCIIKIDNTHYLRITETSTANNEVCISGYLERAF